MKTTEQLEKYPFSHLNIKATVEEIQHYESKYQYSKFIVDQIKLAIQAFETLGGYERQFAAIEKILDRHKNTIKYLSDSELKIF